MAIKYRPNQYNELDNYQQGVDNSNRDSFDASVDDTSNSPLPINQLRVNSLFGTNVPLSNSSQSNLSKDDPFASYDPSFTSRDRYNDLLMHAPQINSPGVGRTLGAALMGLSGKASFEDQQKMMYAPYLREQASWNAKTKPFYDAADLENRSNTNERTLAGNYITAKTQADKLADNSRIQDEKNRITEAKNVASADNARIRARAMEYTARLGKGWDWDLTGPTAKKINKSTGEIIDTGLETGKMDEETRIGLQNEGKIAAAQAQGQTQAALTERRQHPDITIGGVLHSWNPNTGDYEPSKFSGGSQPDGTPNRLGTPKTVTPKQTKEEMSNALQDIYNKSEKYREFINVDDNGSYSMTPRPGNTWRNDEYDQEQQRRWDELHDQIYGSSNQNQSGSGINSRVSRNTVKPSSIPGGAWTQHSPSTGQWRYSVDGGKTWKIVR